MRRWPTRTISRWAAGSSTPRSCRRRNSGGTEDEKAAIKEGRIPEHWQDKPAKIRQKDRDARWSLKYTKAKVRGGSDPKAFKPVELAIPMFGYKNHNGI